MKVRALLLKEKKLKISWALPDPLTWVYYLENWHGFYFIEKDKKKALFYLVQSYYGKNFNPDMTVFFLFLG